VFTRLISSTLLAGLLLTAVPLLARGQAPADKAIIVVKVPEDAKLTIQGDATKSTGPERRFITPPLREGVTYSYNLVATWKADGKDQTADKKVTFKAGQTVTVAFDKTPPVMKDKDKDKDKKKKDDEAKKKKDEDDKKKKDADDKKKKDADDKKKKDDEAKKKKDEDDKKKKKDADKKNADYLKAFLEGSKAAEAGKFADAIKAYDAALKAKPGDKVATDLRALAVNALDAEKKAAEAKKKADEAKKKDDEKKKDADDKKKKDDEDKKAAEDRNSLLPAPSVERKE